MNRFLIRILVSIPFMASLPLCAAEDLFYLDAAVQAGRWIQASAIRTEKRIAWPADPTDAKTVGKTLYSGTPGVILFILEAHHSTGDPSYLEDARGGANDLLASLEIEKETGLYEGLAGIGFALAESFKVTGDDKYRAGALRCVQLLRERAHTVGRGVQWSETTDIISGNAGTGLFLLYAAREFKDDSIREMAVQSGKRQIELGRAEPAGLSWSMDPTFPRRMPNFSHGTAGVAYFLATLYAETKETEFLDAAVSGAKYLQSVANTKDEGCLIFHDEPDGKDLYYLGWCHGPVGTARLFYRLWQVTNDKKWMESVEKCARSVMQSGIPEQQTPGFWNNVSQCCGSAGVVDFFLDLHRVTGKSEYLNFAKRVANQLLASATREGDGMKWIQAEHRVHPELLIAQTGYSQGAAGIGMCLLHLDAFEQGKKPAITFPDSPF